MKKKISIITVVKNRRLVINEAIDSILGQKATYPIESIVVDGGSTDGTLDILKKYGDKIYLISEPDRGVYDALNKGLKIANGSVIGILHSDDKFRNSYVINDVMTLWGKEDDLDLVIGNAEVLGRFGIKRYYNHGTLDIDELRRGQMPPHTAIFFNTSIFGEFGLYSNNYKIAGDYDFLCRMVSSRPLKIRYWDETVVTMRGGGLSNRNLISFVKLNIEVLRACRANSIDTNIILILSKYVRKLLEFRI